MLEIVCGFSIPLQGFQTKRSSKVSVCIFGIALDDSVEIFNGFVVELNHLMGFGSFMNVFNFLRYSFNASTKEPYRFFEFLYFAIRKANVVIYVCFKRNKWFVSQSKLHCLYAFFVICCCIVSESQLIQNNRVVGILRERRFLIFSTLIKHPELVVALGSIS